MRQQIKKKRGCAESSTKRKKKAKINYINKKENDEITLVLKPEWEDNLEQDEEI